MEDLQKTPARLTFLGTGTSIGVPVIGCDCAVCRSDDPKNTRLRSSLMVEVDGFRLVVDTGPDFRQQCLSEGVTELDAAIFTHAHSDHIMGFDDLRRFTLPADRFLPIYATEDCMTRLEKAFEYAFDGENHYPGYLKPRPQVIDGPFQVGPWEVTPLPVTHGKVVTVGFLFDHVGGVRFAYIPDAKLISAKAMELLQDVPLLIIDGLQMEEHWTHLSIPEAVEVITQVKAKQAWLTHLSCRVDYTEIEPTLPDHIRLAWDGLKVSLDS
ncbi:MAG: MBL fold metallo-hydrolase [Verrucomicrobiota bacterium]